MSISPPSDIVLDVARASDPEKYRAAVERLARAGDASAVSTENAVQALPPAKEPAFAAMVQSALQRGSAAQAQGTTRTAAVSSAAAASSPAQSAPETDARSKAVYRQFEAFLLQTFVESMLPKDAENSYGSGTAGSIWRSMFAERIADEFAKSAKLGIAERIADHKAQINSAAQPGGAASQSAPAAARQADGKGS